MSKKRLLLVDGNALLYRAYHAFPKELTTSTGETIGAVYGFTRILLSTLKTLKPTSVAVCFDLKGPTFRHKQFEAYKGTRQKMPDDLASQIARTHEIVEKLEFPIYTAEGFEADDVIGTIAGQATKHDKETEVVILTGDQDILQLVTDRILVYMPVTSSKTPVMYTPEKVQERYGFAPNQIVEYKALRGDTSDNIPGVPGIGEVTATKLVQTYGDIEKLYLTIENETPDDIKPGILSKLKEHKESAFLSRELATIVTIAPVTFDADCCALELKAPESLIALFKQLGFKSLLNDLPVSHRILSHATDVFSATEPEEAQPARPQSKSDEINQEVAPVLRKMEKRGVTLDCDYLKQLEKEFTTEIEKIKAHMFDLAGEEFNPDSPQQIAHTFYETLKIPTTFVRKGKTGYTTDAATMQKLATEYPIATLLLQYRELTKLLNTYVKPLQLVVDEHGRVHTSYAPDTSSGRLSSRDPNLQNIPIRSEQGKRLRKAFVAEKGKVLLAADYSQLELRVAAHLSGDHIMKEAFQAGRDFHTETAERMGVDRRMAKIINFSILYGKGAFGFAVDMNITVPEAKKYIEQYFATFPELRKYLDKVLEDTRKNGYAETMFGHRRSFPDITSSNFQRRSAAEREALNMPIQGTGADILKMAMIELENNLEKTGAQMILTVHDELVLEVPEDEVPEVSVILHDTMKNVVTLDVPLEVTVKLGCNWAEMEPISLPS